MTMGPVYRHLTQETLDLGYNSDAAVPECRNIMKQLRERSAAFRQSHPANLDLRYGSRERNLIDFFSAGIANAPTLVFFHGGNWRSGAKNFFSAIAEGLITHGINVALIGYSLVPEVRMEEIVQEATRSVAFLSAQLEHLKADPDKIILSGWSAGGQLAALCMDMPRVVGGVVVSGLFDLEPLQLSYLNESIKLSSDEVKRCSPFWNIPSMAPPLSVVVGAEETSELVRQSRDYAQKWINSGLNAKFVELDDQNHFSILNEFGANGKITALIAEFLGPQYIAHHNQTIREEPTCT